jgi:hypothetical protein
MRALLAAILLFASSHAAIAADEAPLTIRRAPGPISVDGDLSDAGWQNALTMETWYETNPGDNVEPKVKTIGYAT